MLLQKDKNLAVILNNPNWLNAQSSRYTAPYWGSSSGTGSLRIEAKWMRRSGKGISCYNSTVNEPDVTRRPSVRDSLGVCHATGKNDIRTLTPCSLIYCLMSSKSLGDVLITRLSFLSPTFQTHLCWAFCSCFQGLKMTTFCLSLSEDCDASGVVM